MKKTSEEVLEQILGKDGVLRQEPMAAHTSFRVGGPADYFLRVSCVEELRQVLSVLQKEGEPYYLLGRGTNLLVGDRGYRGAVITFTGRNGRPVTDTAVELQETVRAADDGPADTTGQEQRLDEIRVEGSVIRAGAGTSLAAVAVRAKDAGLGGLEFAGGIPGSVGGALVMNAGAYDGCMQQVVESAKLLMPDGKIMTVSNQDMRFAYRRSVLREIPAVALEAEFRLQPADPEGIEEKMREFSRRRHEKQPLEYPSAGSTFKRPEGHFAGKLIQDAGLAGYTVGGACVSRKHCGFVINENHATAADIRRVIEDVQRRVFECSGVRLEPEVICLGDF